MAPYYTGSKLPAAPSFIGQSSSEPRIVIAAKLNDPERYRRIELSFDVPEQSCTVEYQQNIQQSDSAPGIDKDPGGGR